MNAKLVKTTLGRTEMLTRGLGLPVLERRLLILADGTRTLEQLQAMLPIPVLETAAKLQAMGLLESAPHGTRSVAPDTPTPPSTTPPPAVPFIPQVRASAPISPDALAIQDFEIGVDVDIDAEAAFVEDLASDFAEEKTSTWPEGLGDVHVNADQEGNTQPGLLTHRAATPLGLVTVKAYLIETVESMLAKDGVWLVRKISKAQTEADLYYGLELLVTTVSVYTSQSSINSIIRRFEEKISQR